uniref:Ig-like domain-containing protein n=1 Tax=Macrostomum lignano TaxID=282301 RepID=A0A1I8ITC0_9PLAT
MHQCTTVQTALVVWLLLLKLIPCIVQQSNQIMPQFIFSPPSKLLFNWDDVWEAGYPDSLAVLSADHRITVQVSVAGNFGGGLKIMLAFRCAGKSVEEQLDLDSLTTASVTEQCSQPGSIAFSISKRFQTSTQSTDSVLTSDFILKMSTSRVSYENVFKDFLEFRILVQYSGGELQSNSMSVWNLDPISAFPAVPPVTAKYSSRSFLTQSAISFLTGREFADASSSINVSSLQFVEPSMVALLAAAPAFLRQRVNLGALLNFDANGCSYVQYERSTMFTSYDSKFDSRHTLLQKLVRLDLSTGLLWYSKCRLSNEIYNFYLSRMPASIGLCLVVSVSGQMQPYYRVSTVHARLISPTDFNYKSCTTSSASKVCSLVPNTYSNVTVFAGADFTALVCPIVCDDPTIVYRFYANGRLLIPPTVSDWDSAVGISGVRVARAANIIELSPDRAPSGVYRCTAGSRSFTFNVLIVAAPSFAKTDSGSAAAASHPLPGKVLAMAGEVVSYTCAASYAGLSSVRLQGVFYLASNTSTGVSWTRHSLSSFQQLVGISANELTVSLNSTAVGSDRSAQTLTTVLQPPASSRLKRPFDHRFVCEVGVNSNAELANKFGLNSSRLSAQTGSNILYLSRPSRADFIPEIDENSCSTQRCYAGRGAKFKFGFTASYGAYLNQAGVEVLAYLRLDSFLLTDVTALMRQNVSSLTITANNASQHSLLIYEIFQFDSANAWSVEARNELQKRTALTAVFNFRYKSLSSELTGLKLDKSRYGSPTVALGRFDCRADPLCFYSTDFDAQSPHGSLSFLSVQLAFQPPGSQQINQAGISFLIVIIVVCAIVIIVLAVLLFYFANRSPAKTYRLEEKEIHQGHDPRAEARDEKFKEYQRAEARDGWPGGFANVAFTASSGQINFAAHQGTRESDL